MNIARAAKGAAYLLMVFGLVALVACQAGPAGPKGATGDKGDPGVAGKPGAPGTAALAAVGGSTTAYHILINNKGTAAAPTEGDLKAPSTSADVTELFIGGVQPVTYTLTQPGAATDHFTAKINDDNVIEVGKRTGSTADLTAATTYTTGGTALTVTATDANGVVATKAVTIKHNRAPVAGQLATHARLKLVVGTQPEEHKTALTPSVTYKAMNKIHNLDISGTRGPDPAYQPYWGTGGTAAAQRASVEAEDGETVTFEITKIERGTDDAKKGADHVKAELSGARNHLLSITGLKSTWDTSLDPDNHLPVNVEITATDTGGMSTKITFLVTVDGAPQVGATAPNAAFSARANGVQTAVVRNLPAFYTDPEGVARSIVGVSIDPPTAGDVAMDATGNHLMLTPNNRGKATITYYALSDGRPAAGGIAALSGISLDRDGDGDFETAALEVITNQVIKGTIEVTLTP